MPIEHLLSGETASGGNVSLELPRTSLASPSSCRFAACDAVQAVEVGNGAEDASVKRMGRLVKVDPTRESDDAFDDLGEQHEEEEDERKGDEDED